jgi:hypothetical protein
MTFMDSDPVKQDGTDVESPTEELISTWTNLCLVVLSGFLEPTNMRNS